MSTFIAIDLQGYAQMDAALADAPGEIVAALGRAGAQAASVLANSIAIETPVRTGFLLRNETVFQDGPFALMFRDEAFYASFVLRRNPFVERGVEDIEPNVVAIYDRELEAAAEAFGNGIE